MSSEAGVLTNVTSESLMARWRNFRIIPRIETYPAVVNLAQTSAGKLGLLALFGLLLYYANPQSWLIVACLAITTFLPKKRHLAMGLGTLGYTVALVWVRTEHRSGIYISIAVVFALAAIVMRIAAARQSSRVGRHPLMLLLSIFTGVILLCCWLPAGSILPSHLWQFTTIFGTYVWFIGYVLLDREARPFREFGLEVGTLRPFWGSTLTPFPNGSACLRQIEAKDAEQLAIIQLKGLKLLVWSILLSLFEESYIWFFHGHLRIPRFERALYLSSQHTPLPPLICWASVILYFFYKIIDISVWGHRIIACCRMAGFDALRNTYRPFSSTTVAEFFNRFYFYYKELLVHFFFFPTFLRLPERLGKSRMTISIFVAACLGNTYYHFTRELGYLQTHSLWQSMKSFQVFFFYSMVLAAGISLSRQRGRPDPSKGFVRRTLIPAFLVSLFYCLLGIFATTDRNYPLVEHLRFLGHLFLLN